MGKGSSKGGAKLPRSTNTAKPVQSGSQMTPKGGKKGK